MFRRQEDIGLVAKAVSLERASLSYIPEASSNFERGDHRDNFENGERFATRHPKHLKGRDIGLWYAARYKYVRKPVEDLSSFRNISSRNRGGNGGNKNF